MVGMRQSLIEWLDRDHREYHSGLSAKSDGEVMVDALVEWLRENAGLRTPDKMDYLGNVIASELADLLESE